ncbi:hypothetical protein DFA_05696 [Cavenderia fasciculata]|uniref:THH1/TOM1/TOM3 domain-containing protein n=1 Tax=Cavenderia fasciculata TaxID=261658 RepID=F4PM63_CACFS|nr:uncharacterized protein DFA_05696 [Cavenderia fasciculata]EGG23563.1 hypothetical protein DFA_05696 [Cavenderia fasciculata]|eukprot:XP_004361414.1 hypothetical protein DFA_05696 [Cavenderia fasciculata]
MVEMKPEYFADADYTVQAVFMVFGVIRVLVYFYYAILCMAQVYHEAVKIFIEKKRKGTSRTMTRRIIYIFLSLFLLLRTASFAIKLAKTTNMDISANHAVHIAYDVLIVVGTWAIIIVWFEIGWFWVLTFYLFYGRSGEMTIMDPTAKDRVNRFLVVGTIVMTITYISIAIGLAASYQNKTTIMTVYIVAFLLTVIVAGGFFFYHGYVLARALKNDMKKTIVCSGNNKNAAVALSITKTTNLVKCLGVIIIVSIIRSIIFDSGVVIKSGSFAAESLGDFFAILLEIGQCTIVMITISSSFLPLLRMAKIQSMHSKTQDTSDISLPESKAVGADSAESTNRQSDQIDNGYSYDNTKQDTPPHVNLNIKNENSSNSNSPDSTSENSNNNNGGGGIQIGSSSV